jgi:hypothetical protein
MASIINATTSSGVAVSGDTSGVLQLATNGGTTAVTIDTSQNVGIGTSSPAERLRVQNTTGVNTTFTNNVDADLKINLTSGVSLVAPSTGTLALGTSNTERMRISSAGNVGIGTSSPTDTSGFGQCIDGNSSTGFGYYARQAGSSTNFLAIGISNSNAVFSLANTTGYMGFYTNAGTERMRLDSNGNLLIGTTNATGDGGGIELQGNTLNGGYIDIKKTSSSVSGNQFAVFVRNGSVIGSITQNGTTGVLYNVTSDYRLKNNPTPLTGASEFIMALQPKTWDWWDGSGKGVGFIAHEFMEVAKYSGNGKKDEVDVDGKPVYQSIQPSSSEVMANLVALVQEQQALITTLQTQVAELKQKVGA